MTLIGYGKLKRNGCFGDWVAPLHLSCSDEDAPPLDRPRLAMVTLCWLVSYGEWKVKLVWRFNYGGKDEALSTRRLARQQRGF
jgi:hypothetical protein